MVYSELKIFTGPRSNGTKPKYISIVKHILRYSRVLTNYNTSFEKENSGTIVCVGVGGSAKKGT